MLSLTPNPRRREAGGDWDFFISDHLNDHSRHVQSRIAPYWGFAQEFDKN